MKIVSRTSKKSNKFLIFNLSVGIKNKKLTYCYKLWIIKKVKSTKETYIISLESLTSATNSEEGELNSVKHLYFY